MPRKTIAALHQKGKSRSPVEDTVRQHWDDFVAGASNGHSRADIRRIFMDAGLQVGSPAGFNAAIARVAAEKGASVDDLIKGVTIVKQASGGERPATLPIDAAPQATGEDRCSPSANIGREKPPTEVLSPFVDRRFTSNF